MDDLELIWKEFESASVKKSKPIESTIESYTVCRNCTGTNIIMNSEDYICNDCGLIVNENRLNSCSTFDNIQPVTNKTSYVKYGNYSKNKLFKMQEWYMWTNEEKNTYKLKTYVIDLCQRLKIAECLTESICNTVIMVMDSIKKNDGTKRARVKDGIIVSCIHYVSKDTSTPYCYIDLAKMLDLDIKYVTRAERIIIELINGKKLYLNKTTILDTQKPYDYVINVIKKNGLKVDQSVLGDVKVLIEICEDNDILLDHTPLSVGVCCFYYILQRRNIDIDLKVFSDLYDLSVVTVLKTYNKLKVYDKQIDKMLNV
jgi:transcription initiation factor TFIIIB Brf1 subunit/transcription initiation factor TFIIB